MAAAGGLIVALDLAALAIFILEIAAKLFVYRLSFFRDPQSTGHCSRHFRGELRCGSRSMIPAL